MNLFKNIKISLDKNAFKSLEAEIDKIENEIKLKTGVSEMSMGLGYADNLFNSPYNQQRLSNQQGSLSNQGGLLNTDASTFYRALQSQMQRQWPEVPKLYHNPKTTKKLSNLEWLDKRVNEMRVRL